MVGQTRGSKYKATKRAIGEGKVKQKLESAQAKTVASQPSPGERNSKQKPAKSKTPAVRDNQLNKNNSKRSDNTIEQVIAVPEGIFPATKEVLSSSITGHTAQRDLIEQLDEVDGQFDDRDQVRPHYHMDKVLVAVDPGDDEEFPDEPSDNVNQR